MNHLARLKGLKGKEHIYKTDSIVITDYEMDEEGMYLKVNRSGKATELMVPTTDMEKFFNELLPIDATNSVADLTVYQSQQGSLAVMRAQLMELNKKLAEPDGEKYIKQAKAVNNNINTLLHSLKLEFQITKEIHKHK